MSINRSGGLFDKLLHEPLGGRRKLRAALLPVLHPLHVDAQRLAPLGRLRVVEAQALEKLARSRPARIRRHQVEERTLVGAAAPQSNHHHLSLLRNGEKARIIREKTALLQGCQSPAGRPACKAFSPRRNATMKTGREGCCRRCARSRAGYSCRSA